MSGYLTVSREAESEYTEKRSRFLGLVFPCKTEEEALKVIDGVKTRHWDARHNCYAFVVDDGRTSRFSDDGEPHGTAGKPILEVINGRNLKNVGIVVTRYFGGVLLGTGGLVRAYTAAARDAVENTTLVEMIPCTVFSVECEYSEHQTLMKLLENSNAAIKNTEFTHKVKVDFALRDETKEVFIKNLTEIFSAKLTAAEVGTELSPFEVKI